MTLFLLVLCAVTFGCAAFFVWVCCLMSRRSDPPPRAWRRCDWCYLYYLGDRRQHLPTPHEPVNERGHGLCDVCYEREVKETEGQ